VLQPAQDPWVPGSKQPSAGGWDPLEEFSGEDEAKTLPPATAIAPRKSLWPAPGWSLSAGTMGA
jgi:hypothetical protein